MAEVAAGAGAALAAEEVISTTVQAGVGGYMIAKPTMPLKVTYTMIAYAEDDSSRRSLARSHHTLTVIANKAYIFGGETAHQGLASNDMHVVTLASSGKPEADYHLIPALPRVQGGGVPEARTKHAACAFDERIAIYGGTSGSDEAIDDGSSIWLFNPAKAAWSRLTPANTDSTPGPRLNCKLFSHRNTLILCGGENKQGHANDVWRFDVDAETWTQIPSAPVATSNAALATSELYLISGSNPMSSKLHHFDISSSNEDGEWETFVFPTNPMAPGPRARHGGGLLPITTGYGRNYLVYFLGGIEEPATKLQSEDETHDVTQWSDMWTLQLPSSNLEAKPKLSIGEAIKPAKIKDAIRVALGAESGKYTWAEAQVQVPDLNAPEGKLHPGPRESFGYDVMEDKRTVVLWGGQDAKGERVGDGWLMKLE